MFGYIKIEKNELKVKDYNLFRAYYCGLCRTLKSEYGTPCHYFLSYDSTFLALLLSSLEDEPLKARPVRCMANPAKTRPALCTNRALSYAAAVNVLLVWFKLADDLRDEKSIKAALLMPLMHAKCKKARKKHPKLYEEMKTALSSLSAKEKANCNALDEVADAFGVLMQAIFKYYFETENETTKILAHVGYLLGRFIYILDAWEDREKDAARGSYNPFLLAGTMKQEDVELSLTYTLQEIAASTELLHFYKNEAIIENILYLGLKEACSGVLNPKETKKENRHERPL